MSLRINTRSDTNFISPLVIGGSFFIAALLAIVPLPVWLTGLRPPWLLMTLIYWLLRRPYHIGLGVTWLLGLFADLLHGSLLGEHAYAFVSLACLSIYFHQRINSFPFRQQMLVMLSLLSLYQLLLLFVKLAIGHVPDLWLFWLPAVTGTLLWPFIYGVLEMVGGYFDLVD